MTNCSKCEKPNQNLLVYRFHVARSHCYIFEFGHVWTAGFQRNGKVTVKGGEDTNCRQTDDYTKKCDSYQAANIKRKKYPKNMKILCMKKK